MIKYRYPLFSFLLFVSVTGLAQDVLLPACKNKMVVICHRGDHTHAPENTLAAYQHAIEAGADYVEIDLRTTKDSQLVIMHNITVDHMTGSKGRVKDFMFDSLRMIKVREPQHPEWGLHLIPTFKEVLMLCKGKINIYLDFKEASVAAAFNEIVKAGMEKNVVVYINGAHQYTEWRKIAPQMPLMISLPTAISTKEKMYQLLDSLQVDILDGNYTEYNTETVIAAKEKNVPVWADIQSPDESAAKWEKAVALGLAGLQTDHPRDLIHYLIKKGIR